MADLLDLKTTAGPAVAWLGMMLLGATYYDWSAPTIVLVAVAFAPLVAGLVVYGRWLWLAWQGQHNNKVVEKPGSRPELDRISVAELLQIATTLGWDFTSSHSLHLLDLQDAMRQSASDGTLTIWGKFNKWSSEELMRKELPENISKIHWRDYFIHLFAATEGDNFNAYSWTATIKPFGHRGYVDLHVQRTEATDWLQREASSFKGRRKPK